MTATLTAKPRSSSPVEVPEWFRLSDENPLTGQPYSASRTFELPDYIQDAIEETLGITGPRWNELVGRGEVYTLAGPRQRFSLARFLRSVRSRSEFPPASLPARACADCWGTCATHDFDGSITGSTRGVYLCSCAQFDTRRNDPAAWR